MRRSVISDRWGEYPHWRGGRPPDFPTASYQGLKKAGVRADSQDSRGFGRNDAHCLSGTVEKAKSRHRSAYDMSPSHKNGMPSS